MEKEVIFCISKNIGKSDEILVADDMVIDINAVYLIKKQLWSIVVGYSTKKCVILNFSLSQQ